MAADHRLAGAGCPVPAAGDRGITLPTFEDAKAPLKGTSQEVARSRSRSLGALDRSRRCGLPVRL